MGGRIVPLILVPVVLILLLDLLSFDRQAGVAGIHIRQTFYDSPSSDDYSATSNIGGDFEVRSRSFDYEDAEDGGYQEGEDGSKKQGSYALEAAENDAYGGYQSPGGAHEPRSSHRDSYEPVYHRKSKSPKGHSGGYNDEDDDDGYQKKKTKKKKVRPKVIIVKKIIPLSTTTAVNVQ